MSATSAETAEMATAPAAAHTGECTGHGTTAVFAAVQGARTAVVRGRRRGRFLFSMAASAGLHAGAFLLFGHSPAEPRGAVVAEDSTPVETFEMPALEPETPIETVASDETVSPPEFAPPTIAETPAVSSLSEFVQKVEPVIPRPNVDTSRLNVIPSNHSTAAQVSSVRLFDFSELDRVPRRLRTVTPVYPTELRRARVQGEVTLILIIDEEGRVSVERVAEATVRDFAQAAIAAVEQCVFEPPLKSGRRVRARYSMRVPFVLQ